MSGGTASLIFWFSLFFVFYTYAVYPILVALAARAWPRPVARRAGHAPRVTIVVAAHNEAARLEARVTNLLGQDYPAGQMEIIVVSDGSTDGTAALLEALAAREPRLRAICPDENRGKAAALNDGVAAAGGELIIFADARQRFAPDAVARLAENFADERIGSVSGELILRRARPEAAAEAAGAGISGVAADVGLYWTYEKWIRRSESAAGSMLGATGAIYAIRRELWRPLPVGTLLDDFLTPMRIVLAGRRAIFDGRAVAFDTATERAAAEFRRKARTLAGNFQAFGFEPGLLQPWSNRATWFQLWSHKLFRLLVPWALLAAAGASLVAPGGFYTLAAASQALGYGLAAAGWAIERRGRRIPWRAVSLAWTFTALNAAAVVGLWFWLRGERSGRIWKPAKQP